MDARKRGIEEGARNSSGGSKKSKKEMQSLSSGVGSKSKQPCAEFFSFGASASKITVLRCLVEATEDINLKKIQQETGVELSIRCDELYPGLTVIELNGTFEQVYQARTEVWELIENAAALNRKTFKMVLCDNFMKGSCRLGEICPFAHGSS